MSHSSSGSSADRPVASDKAGADRVIAHLTEQNNRFLAILDAHPERISVVDPGTHEILFVNRRYRESLTLDPVGQACFRAFHQFDEPCDFCRGNVLAAMPGQPMYWERHDERTGRDYEITDILIPWTDGRLVHYQLSAECTERKKLQRKLEQNLAELSRSNTELEQFAYLASHDLQEPLRKIQSFGDRLAIALGDKLDDASRDNLTRMLDSARRMQQLINDLLTYSRVGMHAHAFAEIDVAAIAQDVVSDLESRLQETGGRVEVGPVPPFEADPTQIRMLLQNLVGNSLKFHRPGVPPLVTITGSARVGTVVLTIADNGIGFDEKYKDRVFRIFQRLHSRQDYEGTGLGLAVCEKIVHRHGGTIDVTSRPDCGTVFTVELPRHQPAGKD
ncbi:MAG: hypothetical protein IPH48_21265 [bacterium]|jgi:signal transduction histidine kinase|nr:hypothetical protein [bacterium]MBK9776426.1 hypothetical protein [bacterium]